jgi:catechol 2,3-dioxygenase-like lactoylglutathione lyase family enzyme
MRLFVRPGFLLLAALASGTACYAQEVVGAPVFTRIVEDLDRSLSFYRDVIGLEPGNVRPFGSDPDIMKMGNTLGAQSRLCLIRVPGFAMSLVLIEYKDIERRPAHPRFQDPGTGNLVVRVKDLDTIVARVRKAGTRILTLSGAPAEIQGARAIFLQDPDGFIVVLTQTKDAAEGARNVIGGNVIGGGIEVTVADAVKTAAFYRDALGFKPTVDASYNNSKLMTDTAGTPGAQFREMHATIPGSQIAMSFIEFKDIDRKPLQTRLQDPGTSMIQLRVQGLDALLPKAKAAGAVVVSAGGEPVQVGTSGRYIIVRDPNNLLLELVEPPAK